MQSSRRNVALVSAALALLLALPRKADDDESIRVAKAFLVEAEGVVLRVYDDGAGYATAGIGHRMRKGDRVPKTVAEAIELLDADVREHLKCIIRFRPILKANEFAAVLSFVFNIGCGKFNAASNSVRKHLEAGRVDLVPAAMAKYIYSRNKATGKLEVNPGLVNRRNKELKLWSGETWERFSNSSLHELASRQAGRAAL